MFSGAERSGQCFCRETCLSIRVNPSNHELVHVYSLYNFRMVAVPISRIDLVTILLSIAKLFVQFWQRALVMRKMSMDCFDFIR